MRACTEKAEQLEDAARQAGAWEPDEPHGLAPAQGICLALGASVLLWILIYEISRAVWMTWS